MPIVMHPSNTKDQILNHALELVACQGIEGVSIRALAGKSGIAPSVIYHHFKDKETLLKTMFFALTRKLGHEVSLLPEAPTVEDMLRQRLNFQLDHGKEVVALLRYFVSHKDMFPEEEGSFVPKRAYAHITAVLERGVAENKWQIADLNETAKVITHAINGFVLEYFPHQSDPNYQDRIINPLYQFILNSLNYARNQPSKT